MADFSLGVAALGTEVDLDGLGRGIDKAEKISKSGFGRIGDFIGGAFKTGLAVAGGGLLALGAALGKAVGEASEAQGGLKQLDAVLESTGGKAGVTKDQVLALADSLSAANGLSKFTDDAILSGQNLLLTFTNIGKDVFPDATQAMLDMAQAMGGDPQAQAIQLGKALNDPVKGVTALTRVGVTFTDQQKAMIEAMVKAGNTAGAQRIILKELATEFGGSAAKAAETFSGRLLMVQEKFNGILEDVGTKLLPILEQFLTFLASPAVMGAIEGFANMLVDGIGSIAGYFQAVVEDGDILNDFLADLPKPLQPIMQGLAALGIWIGESLPKAIQTASTIWETLLKPIFTAAAQVVTTQLIPAISDLTKWVGESLFGAGQKGGGVWQTTLLPALQTAAAFIATEVIPRVGELIGWLRDNLPKALQTASAFWTSTLLPALKEVSAYFNTNILPVIKAVLAEVQTNLPRGIKVLADFWTNTLLPALQGIWSFVQSHLIPLFKAGLNVELAILGQVVKGLANIWNTILWPAMQSVYNWITGTLIPTINRLTDNWQATARGIERVTGFLNSLADKIRNFKMPDWLTKFMGGAGKALGIPGYASGVRNAPGGLSWVGEQGPELINVPRGSDILSSRDSRATLAGASSSINLGGITITNPVVDSAERVNQLADAVVRKVMAALHTGVDDIVNNGVLTS